MTQLYLDNHEGVKHNGDMKQQTPVSAETLAGVLIRTAKAARVLNSSIRLFAVELNRSFHNDLSQLPDRYRKGW